MLCQYHLCLHHQKADEKLGEAVTLFIEGSALAVEQENLLQQKIATLLERYELPKQIRYEAFFQETPTGKLDKKSTLNNK